MKDYTTEEIQAQFEKLPKELQDAISSPEVLKNIQKIGKKHNLLIDQIGDLVDQVCLVMLGWAKGSEFVVEISKRLSINPVEAQKIAIDINTEVLSKVKTHIRETEEKLARSESAESTVSSIESAGDFSVMKEKSDSDNGSNLPTPADRSKILAGLENPTGTKTGNTDKDNFTEPLVDQLLSAPRTQSATTSKSNVPPTPPTTPKPLPTVPSNLPTADNATVMPPKPATVQKPIPPTPKGPDSYREPIN